MGSSIRDVVLSILGKDGTKASTDSAGRNFDKLSGKVDAAGKSADKFTSKFGAGLRDLQGPLTIASAAVTGFGALSVGSFATFEKSMRQTGAATDATAAEMDQLSGLAKKMGADTAFSAGEAADAMLSLAKGGLSPAQIEAGALAASMNLAAAGGMALADSADTIISAMGAFRLPATASVKVANALAGAANASTANVSDLAQALSQVGAQANNSHLTLQETVGVLAAFANSGINGADAGTSLKTMLMRLVPQSKQASETMAKLGINFVNANGSFKNISQIADILHTKLSKLTDSQRAQALETLFGSDATRAATILMTEGAAGIQKYIDAANDQTAAQKMADAAMGGTAGAMERMNGSLDTLKIEFGQALAPAVTAASDALGKAFEWLGKNKPVAEALTGGMVALTVAIWAQNAAWLASPFTWIALGLVALVAGITWVATKTSFFQDTWATVWEFLKPIGAWFAGPFANFFVTGAKAVADVAIWLWSNILGPTFGLIGAAARFLWEIALKPVVDMIVVGFKAWGMIASWVWGNVLSPVFSAIGTAFTWLWEHVINPVIGFIVDRWKGMGEGFGVIATWLKEKINLLTDRIVFARDTIKHKVDDIMQWFKEVPDKIGNFFSGLSDKISSPFRAAFNRVADAWNGSVGTLSWPVPKWVPEIGGKTIGAPKLPHFHSGIDRVPGPPGSEMLAVLQAGEGVISAEDNHDGAGRGGDTYVTIHVHGLTELEDLKAFLSRNNRRRRGLVAA